MPASASVYDPTGPWALGALTLACVRCHTAACRLSHAGVHAKHCFADARHRTSVPARVPAVVALLLLLLLLQRLPPSLPPPLRGGLRIGAPPHYFFDCPDELARRKARTSAINSVIMFIIAPWLSAPPLPSRVAAPAAALHSL